MTNVGFLISTCSNEPKWLLVFGNMDDGRLQFGCQIFIILLVVRHRSIQKRPILVSLEDTEFSSGKVGKF